jgi:hypothetical protein
MSIYNISVNKTLFKEYDTSDEFCRNVWKVKCSGKFKELDLYNFGR